MRWLLKWCLCSVKADTPINDYANVADPADASIFDRVPDWIVKWWWLVLIAVAAMAVTVWLFMKYRKEGTLMPRKPEPSPYETAITALSALKEKKLWEQGMEKEYFTGTYRYTAHISLPQIRYKCDGDDFASDSCRSL